jgi:short-subunit dehydrogenase
MQGGDVDPRGQVAVVTGATGGFGRAIAVELADAGMRVVVTARREEALEELSEDLRRAGAQALPVRADLRDAEDRQALVKHVEETWGPVTVLVNNAGFGHYAAVEETPPGTVEDMVAVNLLAAIDLSRLLLPGMKARRRGHIVNIGSLAGYVSAPPLTVYAATKFGLLGFSDGLRRELRRHPGVHVTMLSAAPARTDFGQVASGGLAVDPARVPGGITPQRVARAVRRALRRPRYEMFVPAYFHAARLARLLPRVAGWSAAVYERRWRRHLDELRR